MEATLCLTIMPQAPSKKLHTLLTLQGSHTSTLLRRPSSFSRSGLRAKFHQALICCHAAPNLGNDNNYKKASHHSNHNPREVAVGVAAAAALACFLGVACARRAGGAGAGPMAQYAWISLPGMQAQQPHHPTTTPPSSLPSHPTQQTLAELLQLLDDAMLKLKEFPGRKKMSDKGDAKALYEEWKSKWESKGVGSEEKYELGLTLTDILIDRGEYIKAQDICQKLELKRPETDGRVPLRLFIVNASLRIEKLASSTNKEWNEILDEYPIMSEPPFDG